MAESAAAVTTRRGWLGSGWRWLRTLRSNPIYLREKGTWGKPNPFYNKLSRYLPLVFLGALVLAVCAGSGLNNPALFMGYDDSLVLLLVLLCLPAMVVTMLTIIGTIIAPVLTAPALAYEMSQGTWEILQVTPQSVRSIVMAKLFGALARMRLIWPTLLVISLLQAAIIICGSALIGDFTAGGLGMATTILRPWLEILFAGFLGMFIATWVRNPTVALASTYGGWLLFKLFNNVYLWFLIFGLLGQQEALLIASSSFIPTLVYLVAVVALLGGIFYRAERVFQL